MIQATPDTPAAPAMNEPSFTIGIEEEYLLVDAETRGLIHEAPPTMLAECEALLEGQVTPEFLQCQIEVGTRVCATIGEARADLERLRGTVASVARSHGLRLVAASTHPFAVWGEQMRTRKERYETIEHDLQGVVRRLVICGMHVHVGLDDDALRIDLMNQMSYVLPHLLALGTSSPFWQGNHTGLKSYRISVWDEMPRTGLPEQFESHGEFQRFVDVLTRTGVIEDGTKIWWDVRPSVRFPTLEMRISDICTRLEDTMCIAALYVSWLRMLYRLRVKNQRWRRYPRMFIAENRWRAQRYGIDQGLVDFGRGTVVDYPELIEEMIELCAEDAEALGCTAEVTHARRIIERGTSAHWQVRTWRDALAAGASEQEALRTVVDMLVEETMHDIA